MVLVLIIPQGQLGMGDLGMVQGQDQSTWMILVALGLKMLSLTVLQEILEKLVPTADHIWKMPLLSAHQVLYMALIQLLATKLS